MSHIHSVYFIVYILTDVYTTHKSVLMWLPYIYTMVYTHHGESVTHVWSSIYRAIIQSWLCTLEYHAHILLLPLNHVCNSYNECTYMYL